MKYFVDEGSIVRRIWGKGDTVLFIFAGASAEFALNKAVDWLYFTGRLPSDPIGRLFSTVTYARLIVFAERDAALRAIDKMRDIHSAVEKARADRIPAWAYRDVLFMLIHYSISSFELLERKLTDQEKEDVFDVFYRVGDRMGLVGLPRSYKDWLVMQQEHLLNDLVRSTYTDDLFRQYRKHLGPLRYFILKQSQRLVVPDRVAELLGISRLSVLSVLIPVYKFSRKLKMDWFLKSMLLPKEYKEKIRALDVVRS